MGAIQYVDLGTAEVALLAKSGKAVLVELSDEEEHWVPVSVLSTPTAAQCSPGTTIDHFRVECWFAEKEGLVENPDPADPPEWAWGGR